MSLLVEVSVQVNRDDMELANLELNNSLDTFMIARRGLTLGGRSWRRQTATAPFVGGRTLSGAVLDIVTSGLTVRCYGATQTELEDRMDELVEAVSRPSYVITVTTPGKTRVWSCEPADVATVDDALDEFELTAMRQTLRLTIPRAPYEGL